MFIFIFVLSLSGDKDVFSSESLGSGGVGGGSVGTNGSSRFLDISIESNRREGSSECRGRSDFANSDGASGEDSRISAISVVSGLDEEDTNKTSESTSTEDDERASIIEVSDIVSEETQTEGPGIDERKEDTVEEEVEDADGLEGDSFTQHSGSNSGGNSGLSASPEEMSILVILKTDELVLVSTKEISTSIVSFSTNERSVDVTETPSEPKNPHPPNSQDDINEDFVPDKSRILSSNRSDFHKTKTDKHQEDEASRGDNPGLIETKGKIGDCCCENGGVSEI